MWDMWVMLFSGTLWIILYPASSSMKGYDYDAPIWIYLIIVINTILKQPFLIIQIINLPVLLNRHPHISFLVLYSMILL